MSPGRAQPHCQGDFSSEVLRWWSLPKATSFTEPETLSLTKKMNQDLELLRKPSPLYIKSHGNNECSKDVVVNWPWWTPRTKRQGTQFHFFSLRTYQRGIQGCGWIHVPVRRSSHYKVSACYNQGMEPSVESGVLHGGLFRCRNGCPRRTISQKFGVHLWFP